MVWSAGPATTRPPDEWDGVRMAKRIFGCIVLCASLVAAASLQAHHSLAGVYALGKEAKVAGTFKAFHLVNPHSSMKLEVKGPNGKVVEWTFTGGSVQQISRLGLKDKANPNNLA